jgi:hypothetical protein
MVSKRSASQTTGGRERTVIGWTRTPPCVHPRPLDVANARATEGSVSTTFESEYDESDDDSYSLSSDLSDGPFPTYPCEISYTRERMYILTTLVDLADRIRRLESLLENRNR